MPPSRGNFLEIPYSPKCQDILTQSKRLMPSKSSLGSIPHTQICLIFVVLKVAAVDLRCFPPHVLILYFMCYIFSHIFIMLHMFHTLFSCNIYFTHYHFVAYVSHIVYPYYGVFLPCTLFLSPNDLVIHGQSLSLLIFIEFSCHHHPFTLLVQPK